ncbi:hypothetical protein [Streptosporangium sp. V21-05]|uniref:hypothetical protein n=1 Tax=Streptosporangium sp. V21-05 TaxID=3446115 RepID=UPI003F529D11
MTSKPTIPIRCACCQANGLHRGRGLINACYVRHTRNGTLNRFPRQPSATWMPVTPKGRQTLTDYAALVAERATPTRIRWVLSLSERQLQRYANAYRTLTAAQAEDRSAA